MPPKSNKRALTETDGNAQQDPKRSKGQQEKSQDVAPDDDADEAHDDGCGCGRDHNALEKIPPYRYVCLGLPRWHPKGEDRSKEDSLFSKSASDHSGAKYVSMWKSWTMLCDWRRLAGYTDPDALGLWVHNDFHNYGIVQLIEKLLVDFDKAYIKYSKSQQTEPDLQDMWAVIATLGWWMNDEDTGEYLGIDDADRACRTVGAIGRAVLTALEALEQAGELKADSVFRDIGLVMSLHLKWSNNLTDSGIEGENTTEWRALLMEYAEAAGIDLKAVGCYGTEDNLQDPGWPPEGEESNAFQKNDKGSTSKTKKIIDHWDWSKDFKAFKNEIGPDFGSDSHNLLTWSRKKRAEHSMDDPKKDPLADVPLTDLKAGNIVIG